MKKTTPKAFSTGRNRPPFRSAALLISGAIALAIPLCPLSVYGQAGQSITGQITDKAGAILPGVNITVHNEDTGVDLKTVTTASGDYTLPYLAPGKYDVIAEKQGFQTLSKTGFVVNTDKSITVNFSMIVGAVSETVRVKESELSLDTVKADISTTIERERITELPLNGRNELTLTSLVPGVNWNQGYGPTEPYNIGFYAVGVNHGTVDINVSGAANTTYGFQSIAYIPPVDALQEFTVTTTQYDASLGHSSGGSIDFTMKGGTNEFHGTAYEYFRRTWMDANTWQNIYSHIPRGQHKQDQYGFQLGGPVRIPHFYDGRNRSFYLISLENESTSVPNKSTQSVPDPAWLPQNNGGAANFSNLTYWNGTANVPVTIYDPLTIHPDSTGTLVRDPFPGNIIPASRINQVAAKMASYFPAPNVSTPSGQTYYQNNYQVNSANTNTLHNVLVKWDQVVTPADRFSLRWGLFQNFTFLNGNGLPNGNPAQIGYLPSGFRYNTFGLEYTHVFSPTKLFDVKSTVAANQGYEHDGVEGFDPSANLGFPDYPSPIKNLFTRFPETSLGGTYGFVQLGSTAPHNSSNNSLAVLPTFTWIAHKHNIRFGADIRVDQSGTKAAGGGVTLSTNENWTQYNYLTSSPSNGPAYSGNSLASFLLGDLTGGSAAINPISFVSDHYNGFWIQDDYKITSKLTLNLGLRDDIVTPVTDRYNQFNGPFDLTLANPISTTVGYPVRGGVTFAGVNGEPRSVLPTRWNLWQPRIGFAYSLNPNTVIRGGFGKVYSVSLFTTAGRLGFSSNTSVVTSLDGGRTAYASISNPFASGIAPVTGASAGALTGLGQDVSWNNPNANWPTTYSFTLGLQRQFTTHDIATATYVGQYSTGGWQDYNFNAQPLAVTEKCNVDLYGPAAQAYCNPPTSQYVSNPFYHVPAFEGQSLYNQPTVSPLTFTAPYPAYGKLKGTGYLNNGRSVLNSLQMVETHRWANALSGEATWVWSKLIDSGGWLSQVYQVKQRTIDGNDITHRVTLSGVWMLPVGRGRTFLSGSNRLVDGVLGGWELGTIYIFESGKPWTFNAGAAYPHNAWVPRKTTTVGGIETVRGVSPCLYTQDPTSGAITPGVAATAAGCTQPDVIYKAANTVPTNTVYTGIRVGWNNVLSNNLSKNFTLVERVKLQIRMDVFNPLNHPEWQNGFGTGNDANFGSFQKGPQGQSNTPRQLQLSANVKW